MLVLGRRRARARRRRRAAGCASRHRPTSRCSRGCTPTGSTSGPTAASTCCVENLGTARHSPPRRHRLVRRGPARRAVPRPAARGRRAPHAPRTGSPPAAAAATASARCRSRSPTRSAWPAAVNRARARPTLVVRPRVARHRGAGRGGQPHQRASTSASAARGGERSRRRVPHPARVRGRRRPAPRALAVDRAHRRAHDPPGRSPLALARRGGARRAPGRATTRRRSRSRSRRRRRSSARLARLRRRVEVITSAGALLGTGGDPRHDVIDRARHRRPRRRATSWRSVLEHLARAPARRPRHRGARPRRPRHRSARSARSAASAWSWCSRSRPRSRRTHSVVVVDASTTPFATAWNETSSAHRTWTPSGADAVMVRARPRRRAARARRAERRRPRCRSGASSTRAGSCCPCVGAALLPHALGVPWCGGAAGRCGWAWSSPRSASWSTWWSRSSRRPPPSASRRVDTWHTLETQLSGGWHLLRTAPAPAPTTDGAILLAVLAVWAMAALADWLAFATQTDARRHRRPRSCSSCGRRRSAPTTRRSCSRSASASPPARSCSRRTSRCSTSVAAGWCRQRGARRHWLGARGAARAAPRSLVGAGGRAARPRVPTPTRSSTSPAHGRDGSRRPQLQHVAARRSSTSAPSSTTCRTTRALHGAGDRSPTTGASPPSTSTRATSGGQWTLSAEGDAACRWVSPSTAPDGHAQQEFDIGPLGERWLPAAFRPVADRPARHARRASRRARSSPTPTRCGPASTRCAPTAPARGHAVHRRAAGSDGGAAAAAELRASSTLPDTADIRQINGDRPASRRRRGRDHAVRARPRRSRDYFRDDNRFRLRHRPSTTQRRRARDPRASSTSSAASACSSPAPTR